MWYLFNYIWIFMWALFNYISFNVGYKCGLLQNWISILCQLSFQQDIKQIRVLTKGRYRTKCSIITMIKSSSTRPTEAVQTSCNQWQTAKCAVVKAKLNFWTSALPSLNSRISCPFQRRQTQNQVRRKGYRVAENKLFHFLILCCWY